MSDQTSRSAPESRVSSWSWHRREFFNTRNFRRTHGRPEHLPRWYWRFMEYRYLYYVVKHWARRA